MERPEPKFVPGEMVEICSIHQPQLSGTKCVVIESFYGEKIDAVTGLPVVRWHHKTDVMSPRANWWSEAALRKLPPKDTTQWDASIFAPGKQKLEA